VPVNGSRGCENYSRPLSVVESPQMLCLVMSDLSTIQTQLREFARERDWEQFHNPKNLSMAIASEAGELLELFQWLSVSESNRIMDDPKKAAAVRQEVADVLIYLVRLADVLQIDLSQAALEKIEANAQRYPISAAKGTAHKYDDFGSI
jgi:dCTP diphosphatase